MSISQSEMQPHEKKMYIISASGRRKKKKKKGGGDYYKRLGRGVKCILLTLRKQSCIFLNMSIQSTPFGSAVE